ncbi:hypothetical protein AA0229_1615 [Gluconobacter cerinus NRIC 0229]|nr:hypothetical protein AA0229_1615 [Gluconobacter cerinus NRIC 0229]
MNWAAQHYDFSEIGADRSTAHHHITTVAVRHYVDAVKTPAVDPVAQTIDRNFAGIVGVSALPSEKVR